MTHAELLVLISSGENVHVEFKRDDIHPDQLAKELTALLNTDGGHLLLGVQNDGSVSGISKRGCEEWVMNIYRENIQPAVNLPFQIVLMHSTSLFTDITRCLSSPLRNLRPASREEVKNPYDIARPATTFFRGREEELKKLSLALEEGKSAVVFGLQRIGKTSLVDKLLSHSLARVGSTRRILPVRIDMFSAWESFTTDLVFMSAILEGVVRETGRDSQRVRESVRELLFGSSSEEERRRKIRDVLAGAQSRVLLFIDEFHDVERVFDRARLRKAVNPVDAGLFRWIGSLVKEGVVQLLLSCRYKAIPMERKERLELFKLLVEVNLGLLDEVSAQALVQDPVAKVIRYDGQAVKRILQLTGRHPYLIQYFCSELMNSSRVQRQRVVRVKDVEECAERIVEDPVRESKFNVLYEDFQEIDGRLPWRTLLALAAAAENGERLISRDEISATFRDNFGRGRQIEAS